MPICAVPICPVRSTSPQLRRSQLRRPGIRRPGIRRPGIQRPGIRRLAALGLILALSGCGTPATGPVSEASPSGLASNADGCIESFDPGVDYFATKQQLDYATNLQLSYHGSYQVVTIPQPSTGAKPERYVLLRCGAPAPELTGELSGAPVITTPVDSVFSSSTTQLPAFEALGRLEVITGVAAKAYISSSAARTRADSPAVIEYAAAGTPDAEAIVAAKPDVLITDGTDSPELVTVRDADIAVLGGADFLETDPLGRAEWIKLYAALTGTEAAAATEFDTIRTAYEATKTRVAEALAAGATPVEVVLGQPYQGVWPVPSGGSFSGALITDAGGAWPWQKETTTGTINADLEAVLDRSGDAPTWITTSNWTTLAEARAEEPRLADFRAFKPGQTWAPSRQVTEAGGNNYYERGVHRPDEVLADLVAILHPDLAAAPTTLTYYQPLS